MVQVSITPCYFQHYIIILALCKHVTLIKIILFFCHFQVTDVVCVVMILTPNGLFKGGVM